MSENNIEMGSLPWTGERFLTEVKGSIELEHFHRYLFAINLCFGKRVLDIASGEGYGSALLARGASSVIGVDISTDAISHAKAKYHNENLDYRLGSCSAIPLEDASVDVVVSYETIEHHYQHNEMMSEIKRVLVPGGLLIISCPDKLEYSDLPGYNNPYHVKELYRNEFESLLESNFKNYRIAGQRVVYGSAIFSEDDSSKLSTYRLDDNTFKKSSGISNAIYLIAIASDSKLPTIESEFLEQSVTESDCMMAANEELVKCNEQIKQISSTLEEVFASASWKMTKPIRILKQLIKYPFARIKN